MSARVRTDRDRGFTLVEILVVIVIIGILAAIAVPMYLDQKAKAHDSSAKFDVRTLGQAIATDIDKHPDLPTITWSGQTYLFDGTRAGALSPGTVFGSFTGSDASDWCVDVTDPRGSVAAVTGFRFSAANGLEEGQC